jgi:hypothetical protein
VRRLVRPVYIWGSEGQYEVRFRLDLMGSFVMRVTFRGKQLEFYDDELNIGGNIGGSPYTIVVKPAAAQAQWTTITGAGLYNTTVGEAGSFLITARDRFGNRVSTGASEVQVVMAIGKARAECWSPPQVRGVEHFTQRSPNVP